MKIIAKTIIGREFAYSTKTAHAVSNRSAERILAALNESRFMLNAPGEIWYIYDVDPYDVSFDFAQTQKFVIRKGSLFEYC